MRVDRSWMYNRQDQSRKGITEEFIRGTDEFIEFAIHQRGGFVSNGMIRCPCSRCDNLKFLDIDVVRTHLYRHGFVPEYYQWVSHGEPYVPMARRECNMNLNSQLRDDSVPIIMEGQSLGGDGQHRDAQNEGDDDDAFIDAQASLPSEKVARAWTNVAGGHIYGLGSHCTVVCNYGNTTCHINAPQQAPPHSTLNVDLVRTPGFEEAVNRIVDQKMSEMRFSIQQDILEAIRSLGKITSTSDRRAKSANSSKNPNRNH